MEEETHGIVKQGSERGGRNAWPGQTRTSAMHCRFTPLETAMLVKTIFALPNVFTPRRATRKIKI